MSSNTLKFPFNEQTGNVSPVIYCDTHRAIRSLDALKKQRFCFSEMRFSVFEELLKLARKFK